MVGQMSASVSVDAERRRAAARIVAAMPARESTSVMSRSKPTTRSTPSSLRVAAPTPIGSTGAGRGQRWGE